MMEKRLYGVPSDHTDVRPAYNFVSLGLLSERGASKGTRRTVISICQNEIHWLHSPGFPGASYTA